MMSRMEALPRALCILILMFPLAWVRVSLLRSRHAFEVALGSETESKLHVDLMSPSTSAAMFSTMLKAGVHPKAT